MHCSYDHMSRRATKQVTVGNNVTLQQRYIYRGYLQVACIDLTRSHHPALWYITWDATQPVATRPLAIQKDGTWYTYGWDLTKNICELYGQHGYIRTAYTYTPYGQVTAEGDVEQSPRGLGGGLDKPRSEFAPQGRAGNGVPASQPIQWSSEYHDTELALVYYNYRHYNPADGRWIGRDRILNYNLYGIYDTIVSNDILGLIIKSRCSISNFLSKEYGIKTRRDKSSALYVYKSVVGNGDEIIKNMILSSHTFTIDGSNYEKIKSNLLHHVETRRRAITIAMEYSIPFPSENENESNIIKIKKQLKKQRKYEERLEVFNSYNNKEEICFGCYGATFMVMSTASSPKRDLRARKYESVHIPGDWLYIKNTANRPKAYHEGENLIYMGNNRYWGVMGTPVIRSYQGWLEEVRSWNGMASSENTVIRFPHEGLAVRG